MAAAKRKPWNNANPKAKSGRSVKLTSSEKTAAHKAAKEGGRRYPNLADNMRAAKRKKKAMKRSPTGQLRMDRL